MKKDIQKTTEIIFYTTPDGKIRVEVLFHDETIWLTQKKLAELFGVEVNTINYHLKEIFKSKELKENSVIRKIRTTADDGKAYQTNFYNLDAIISVGYRVNSEKATHFRIWATQTLKEFIIKGFILDDERLKNGTHFGKDYFAELLERIREIRASERRFYQKITDIYATAIDYNPNLEITHEFFATVQNKLIFGVTGQTAAELISGRVNAKKQNMGLTNWKNSPTGKIIKTDVSISKNYLSEKELKELNLIVTMYLDYAELQAEKQVSMKMTDWIRKLDAFLKFNEMEILRNPGKVSAEVARSLAETHYESFRVDQDRNYVSDFDKTVEKYLPGKPKKK